MVKILYRIFVGLVLALWLANVAKDARGAWIEQGWAFAVVAALLAGWLLWWLVTIFVDTRKKEF